MNLKKTLFLACILLAGIFYLTKIELPKQEAEINKGLIFKELTVSRIDRVSISKAASNPEEEAENFVLINTKAGSEDTESKVQNADMPTSDEAESAKLAAWRLEGVPDLSLEIGSVSALALGLKDMKLSEPLPKEESKGDLKDFGLDKPTLVVKIKDIDGKETELSFGSLNTYLQQRYVKTAGSENIFLIPETSFVSFNRSKFDFREKSPIKASNADIHQIVLENSKGKIVVEQSAEGQWQITEPKKLNADEKAIDDLLIAIKGLKVKDFIDQGAQPKDYGLDKPEVKVAISFNEESKLQPIFVQIASRKETDKSEATYFNLSSSPTVFRALTSPISQLTLTSNELRNKELFKFSLDQLEKVVFTKRNSKMALVTIAVEKDGDSWKVNGKAGDPIFVKQVLMALSSVQASSFVDTATKTAFSNPVLQVALTIKSELANAASQTKLLIVGEPVKGQNPAMYFARVGDDSSIALLSEADLKKINPMEETLLKVDNEQLELPTQAESHEAALPAPQKGKK